MSDTADFGENPFRALNARNFPGKKDAGRNRAADPALKRRHERLLPPPAEAEDGLDAADRELFLRSVGRARPLPTEGGFSLDERGVLPWPESKRARSKKTGGTPAMRQGGGDASAPGERPAPAQDADADGAAAFLRAMGAVRPLAPGGRDIPPPPPPQSAPPASGGALEDFLQGKLEFALSFSDEYLEGHVVGLDEMTMNKLRAGNFSPEAHLDLHGLNVGQAFEALRDFFRGSWYKGLRTVLVVPGRGRNSPDGVGVLREKLQGWLTQEPFKRVVLAFCTAQPHDGGPGSIYVLLRKYRKKGKICWERLPADADLYA